MKFKELLECLDEGVIKKSSGLLDKPFSEILKRSKNTPAEPKIVGSGDDFKVYAQYGGSLKRQMHYVVRDDKIVGSGWNMNSALKDAKIKKNDLNHYSKYASGSSLNTFKEGYLKSGVERIPDAYINKMTIAMQRVILEYEYRKNSEVFAFTRQLNTIEMKDLAKVVNSRDNYENIKYLGQEKSGDRKIFVYEVIRDFS